MAIFRLAVETPPGLEDGAKRKMRKPKDSTAAKTNVIGLVRRIDLGRAMLKASGFEGCRREMWDGQGYSLGGERRASGLEEPFRLDSPLACQSHDSNGNLHGIECDGDLSRDSCELGLHLLK